MNINYSVKIGFIKLLVFTLLSLISLFYTSSVAQAFAGGDGSEGDPYQIINCTQLQSMRDELDAHYILNTHIECADSATWNAGRGFEPVGTSTALFTGSLDGQNFEIRDLYIERADDAIGEDPDDEEYIGLFGYINSATLQNIRFINAYVKGYRYVGGLVGYVDTGTITNIQINTDVAVDTDCDPKLCIWARWGEYGGGIVGYADSAEISYVVVGGAVKGSGNEIGGIVGYAVNSNIENATSTARIDGGNYIGGIVGRLVGGSVSHVAATGAVVWTDDLAKSGEGFRLGGLIGRSQDSAVISYATSTGAVFGRDHVGGLIGEMTDTEVSYSFAGGAVNATSNSGGFAGNIQTSEVSNSYATGGVNIINYTGGGFAGIINSSIISNSYAEGEVNGEHTLGGFSGQSGCSSEISRSYATGNVTGGSNLGGFTGYDDCEGPGSTMNEAFASGDVSGNENVGGFVGYAGGGGMIVNNAYASGDVSGNENVGGFVGYTSNSEFLNVYARGLVDGDATTGGLAGYSDSSTYLASFWDNQTSNQDTSDAGVGLPTDDMKTLGTFTDAGWDFTTIWGINAAENDGYPFFRFQGLSHVVPGVVTPPSSAPSSSSRSGGTSVVRQVTNLEEQGNIERAQELRELYPNIFGDTQNQIIKNLQKQLADLIAQLKA
ncbi:MAG TPA: GLUG motif-containing protein, partial [Candidatus Paceibacterota bacterium]|nr:GLUG motif-containing protein [Candidatus Paceibacterota bacterium]